jgi:hypothetical protein
MRTWLALLLGCLILLSCVAVAQLACRDATATVVESRKAFTVLRVSLPYRSTSVDARAVLPTTNRRPVFFYLCLEHVDNLGAYTASRPETGLLIPSDFVNRLRVAFHSGTTALH